MPMVVSVNLPDAIATQLHLDGEQGARRALEMFALEGYRAGELSRGQVSELLDLEFNETEALLKKNGCGLGLSFEEYEQDSKRLREFLGR
jgi:predicted HTH domain antitoxin